MLKTACDCLKNYIGTGPVFYGIPKFSTGNDRSLAFYFALDEEVFRSIIKSVFGENKGIPSKRFKAITSMEIAQYRSSKSHEVKYFINVSQTDKFIAHVKGIENVEVPSRLQLINSDENLNFGQKNCPVTSERILRNGWSRK